MIAALAEVIALAQANETPCPHDPHEDLSRWGVHHEDPPPYNRLRGPLHPRGPQSGVVWRGGEELAAWVSRTAPTWEQTVPVLEGLAAAVPARKALGRDISP